MGSVGGERARERVQGQRGEATEPRGNREIGPRMKP